MIARRFPPPWTVEELDACFVVRDVNGEVLAYVYCEEAAAKLLSKDEAREAKRRPPFGGLLSWGLREGRNLRSNEIVREPD
jgi:hypothetical protein